MNRAFRRLLHRSGLSRWARRILVRRGAFVLEFHGIASRHYPELPPSLRPHLTAADLRKILTWLRPRFSFLTPDEFLLSHKPGVLLTFDDGFANNGRDALPLLEEFEAPAIFFLTTQHVDDPKNWLPSVRKALTEAAYTPSDEVARDLFDGMSQEEVRALGKHPLVTIGAHSRSHPLLPTCDEVRLQDELAAVRQHLEELTGRTVDLFAYPTGAYDRPVMTAVEGAGYRAAFAEDSVWLGHPRFEIPRVGLYQSGPAYLSLKLSGLHRPCIRRCWLPPGC